MNKPTTIVKIQPPGLEFPGRPAVTARQNSALQAEFFIMKSVERATWAYRAQYDLVVAAMNNLQSNIATEGIATREGQNALHDFLFEDSFNREFFMTIQLNFFAMYGEWHNVWLELMENISRGLTYTPIGREVDAKDLQIAEEIYSRVQSSSEVYEWLLANRWAALLIMVKMWGLVPDAK